jgi:y4mF family transcriptional regulator
MWAQSSVEVGKIVATARRNRELTQAQLARATGVTQAWISQVEQGKDTAQLGKVLRLLSYLGVRLRVGAPAWLADTPNIQGEPTIALSDVISAHSAPPRRKRKRRS